MKKEDKSPLVSVTIPKPSPPQIGISFLQVCDNNYGLAALHSADKAHHVAYKTFEQFLKEVNSLSSIDELRKLYGSHCNSCNTDKVSKRIVKAMKKQYPNIECNELYHIHCKRGRIVIALSIS